MDSFQRLSLVNQFELLAKFEDQTDLIMKENRNIERRLRVSL